MELQHLVESSPVAALSLTLAIQLFVHQTDCLTVESIEPYNIATNTIVVEVTLHPRFQLLHKRRCTLTFACSLDPLLYGL